MLIVLEFVAFVFGLYSVWLAKQVNVLVYPTGLIATIITTYLLYLSGYYGDMLVNAYFSLMSIYGWYRWSRKDNSEIAPSISKTSQTQKLIGFVLFITTIFVVFAIYNAFHNQIKVDNYFDIFASGLFFTAMWFMALKKIENWTLWIIGDVIVAPLFAYRGLGMLAVQYLIFTILAVWAYVEWRKILNSNNQIS